MDDLERRFIALGGPPPLSYSRETREDLPIISAEPYSCIIFTPDDASRWLTSEGVLREILSSEYNFERAQRDYFGEEFSAAIMNVPKVKNLFTQYYLNSKSESEKQIIKEAMEGGGGGASTVMPRAQGGGLKRRKSKKKKSKTRRRRR